MFPNLRKLQLMTTALIMSGSCNIALAGALWQCARNKPTLRHAQFTKEGGFLRAENCGALSEFANWEYARLLAELSNGELMEDGFTRGGLALAILIEKFDFDVDRALLGKELHRRTLKDARTAHQYTLIADLQTSDFERVRNFAEQERWPMTPRGLFQRFCDQARARVIGEDLSPIDPSLIESLFASDAFCAFARLFPPDIPRQYLALTALHLNWSELCPRDLGSYTLAEKSGASSLRCDLLLRAIERGSKPAAYLLIMSDFDFALHKTSDLAMQQLLTLVDTYTAEALAVSMGVLRGPRGDTVRELAAKRACHFLNLPPPIGEQWGLLARALVQSGDFSSRGSEEIAERISGAWHASREDVEPVHRALQEHIVQPGDTLWKLSKTYGMTVRDLMRRNDLSRDFLHIGQILRIDLSNTPSL